MSRIGTFDPSSIGAAVRSIASEQAGEAKGPDELARARRSQELGRVAQEFEALLLRQMLAQAHVGGQKSESGYGSMAVDAMASAISGAGGLGLGRHLADQLARSTEKLSSEGSPAVGENRGSVSSTERRGVRSSG